MNYLGTIVLQILPFVNEQVQITQTIQNMISNYIHHESITCDDKNTPWIDKKIKNSYIKIVTWKVCH